MKLRLGAKYLYEAVDGNEYEVEYYRQDTMTDGSRRYYFCGEKPVCLQEFGLQWIRPRTKAKAKEGK